MVSLFVPYIFNPDKNIGTNCQTYPAFALCYQWNGDEAHSAVILVSHYKMIYTQHGEGVGTQTLIGFSGK